MTGGVHSITGSETLNARLVFACLPPAGLLLARLRRDGQWFHRAAERYPRLANSPASACRPIAMTPPPIGKPSLPL